MDDENIGDLNSDFFSSHDKDMISGLTSAFAIEDLSKLVNYYASYLIFSL